MAPNGADPLRRSPSRPILETALGFAYRRTAVEPFEMCLRAIESRKIEWEQDEWNLLRNLAEGPRDSAKIFDLEISEPGSHSETKDNKTQWDTFFMRKALTCHCWRVKGRH
jgi:hypothetical protein